MKQFGTPSTSACAMTSKPNFLTEADVDLLAHLKVRGGAFVVHSVSEAPEQGCSDTCSLALRMNRHWAKVPMGLVGIVTTPGRHRLTRRELEIPGVRRTGVMSRH